MSNKLSTDRNQKILLELAAQPGNDVCADCKNRMPRWASYNIGIFICVRCASIHRKIGTHVSKVKSLTMDTWTKEQVDTMKLVGNIKSNRTYHPDEKRHPPPTNMMESERDSELEKFIRDKYEFKRFKPSPSAVAASLLGPSRSASDARLKDTPARSATIPAPAASLAPIVMSSPVPVAQPPQRSMTQPPPAVPAPSTSSTFNDLLSLQAPSVTSSLPLQYSPAPNSTMLSSGMATTPMGIPGSTNFATAQFGGGAGMVTSPSGYGAGMGMGMGMSPSVYGTGMTLGGSSGLLNPTGTFGVSPGGLNPFQHMNNVSGSPGYQSSSPGMNPYQGTQFQQQSQIAQPAPFVAQAGTNPFTVSPYLPAMGQGPGIGSSPSPHLIPQNSAFAPSSSPGIGMGGAMNPAGMSGSYGTNMGVQQPHQSMNPFGQIHQQQQPFGQPGGFAQAAAFGQGGFGSQPTWQQQQQGWPGM